MFKKSEKLENKIKRFKEKVSSGFLEKEIGEKTMLGGATSFLLGVMGTLDYIDSFKNPAPPGYPFNKVLEHLSDYQLVYLGVGVGAILVGDYLYNKGVSKKKN